MYFFQTCICDPFDENRPYRPDKNFEFSCAYSDYFYIHNSLYVPYFLVLFCMKNEVSRKHVAIVPFL